MLPPCQAEHSLELHLPYIVASMAGRPFTLVPVMVGALSVEAEGAYGQLLAPYLQDPANCFVVSSDFCHWGSRFTYTFYEPAKVGSCAVCSLGLCPWRLRCGGRMCGAGRCGRATRTHPLLAHRRAPSTPAWSGWTRRGWP